MKKYALFAGNYYYPQGGWDDLVGLFETFAQAMEKAASCRSDWYQVVNLETGNSVYDSGDKA